jgi:cellulose synthase/poly-beta-1,6-N-acetylglucosamine synthase-like glycosyltransferase
MTAGYSVGIAAYNEAANIGRLLDRLVSHGPASWGPAEVLVVASGCTDATEAIVRARAERDGRIRLMVEPERRGKASAVNLLIARAAGDPLVLMSADVLPQGDAVARLIEPFADKGVGVTAGRIMPENDPKAFMGFYANLFWSLHHRVALQGFKAGEVVAFRRVFESIPGDTATDETWIVQRVLEKGLASRYVPEAVFCNRGPDNVRDFLKVRRRHLAGYHHLRKLRPDWRLPDTMDNRKVLKLLRAEISENGMNPAFLAGSLLLELWARLLARFDFQVAKKNHCVWETADSTKRLSGEG